MSEITCARCAGHVELGVLSEHKTYHAVCLIQSHAEMIESLHAQLAQARSDALEEAAQIAYDMDAKYMREQYKIEYGKKRYDVLGVMRAENKFANIQAEDAAAAIRSLKEPTP